MLGITGLSIFLYVFFIFSVKIVSNNEAPSVIIVGAGSAGIAAAAKLLENNITNVIVLEAEERIGGRIHSAKFGDAVVDLGAQFCYGEKGNIVYELAHKYNLLKPGELKLTLYHSTCYEDEDETSNDEELYSFFHSIYAEERRGPEVSLGEYITKRFNESFLPYHKDQPQKIKFSLEFLQFYMRHVLAMEGAFSCFDVAAKNDFKECEGNILLNWKGRGYTTLLDILMRKYPNPEQELPIKFNLNTEVTKIVWDDDSSDNFQKAAVECSDGSVYRADHVIFTPSLGVLKANYITLFQPSLPKEKINAIHDVGMGGILNVYLHFPTRWWPSQNFTDFTFVWTKEDEQLLLQEFLEGPGQNGRSWLLDLLAVYAVEENPNVLLASFTGAFVPQIELSPDSMLIHGIMFVLNKFVGRNFDNIINPDFILRYNWHSNPHFRGTYSFQTVKSREGNISAEAVLSQPLKSSNNKHTLLFAGEATHPTYYSTVHGAIESGHREAERIISYYN